MNYIDQEMKKRKAYYWIKRNLFFRNTPIASFFGQCHFCDGDYFKSENAIEVEITNMPRNNILDKTEYKNNERIYHNVETHKCSSCGQKWVYNRKSLTEISYDIE